MWYVVNSMEDISYLMTQFGNFHDSVLTELKYISGAYVNKDQTMVPLNLKREVSVVFQRQSEKLSSVELVFEGVKSIHLLPSIPDNSCEIFGAQILKYDGRFYWVDTDFGVSFLDDISQYSGNLISGEKLKWRSI